MIFCLFPVGMCIWSDLSVIPVLIFCYFFIDVRCYLWILEAILQLWLRKVMKYFPSIIETFKSFHYQYFLLLNLLFLVLFHWVLFLKFLCCITSGFIYAHVFLFILLQYIYSFSHSLPTFLAHNEKTFYFYTTCFSPFN